MWTQLLIFTVLVSVVIPIDPSTTPAMGKRRKKPTRYRIVKVYTRRMPTTTTPIPPDDTFTEPEPTDYSFLDQNPTTAWNPPQTRRPTSTNETPLPRDMLRSDPNSGSKLEQLDPDDAEVKKILAALGFNPSGDPLAQSVIRLSTPEGEGNSQLDPGYLEKLIKEQLGHSDFQILQPKGPDASTPPNPPPSPYNQRSLVSQPKPVPPSPTYPEPRRRPRLDIQTHGGKGHTKPPLPPTPPPVPAQRNRARAKNSNQYTPRVPNAPAPTSNNFPNYPRSSNFGGFRSRFTTQAQESTTQIPVTRRPNTDTEEYSTLGQAFMPPGVNPAGPGQYADSDLEFPEGKKFSATFVRGFIDTETTTRPTQTQEDLDQPSEQESQWKTSRIPPTGRYKNPRSLLWRQRSHEYQKPTTESSQDGPTGESNDYQAVEPSPEYGSGNDPPADDGPPSSYQPKVTKTVYVNLPPEAPSTTTTHKPYKNRYILPQKHYKIVFIKAPTVPPPEEPEVELPPPTPQTKTIIYVLHKKPEPTKKIVITAPPTTEPPSPEVFFIQYKDPKKPNENQWQGSTPGTTETPKNLDYWKKPEVEKPKDSNWNQPQVQGWSKPELESNWESPSWNESPKGFDWQNVKGPWNTSREKDPKPWWQPKNSDWTKARVETEGWSPIVPRSKDSVRSYEEYEDSQGYPQAQYHMSASESAPVRISVTKTVTKKG